MTYDLQSNEIYLRISFRTNATQRDERRHGISSFFLTGLGVIVMGSITKLGEEEFWLL